MAKHIYYLADGTTEVPSVTTITGKFKNMAGLLGWYYTNGYELGIEVGRGLKPVPEPITKGMHGKRDEAGEIGSALHKLIDDKLNGREWNDGWLSGLPVQDAMLVGQMFSRFLQWLPQQDLGTPVGTELSLVSEMYKYGGTLDNLLVPTSDSGVAFVDKGVILDWKTSKDYYEEMLMQLAAYRKLAWEAKGIRVRNAHVVAMSKTAKTIKVYSANEEQMDAGFEYFLRLRSAFELSDTLTPIIKEIRDAAVSYDYD